MLSKISLDGIEVTDRARAVFAQIRPDSAVERAVLDVISHYVGSIDVLDIETDVDSYSRLAEVHVREGIARNAQDCISTGEDGQRVLTIRGYVPPTIEIYRETTSFVPSSFRPSGYPGTDEWFDKMADGNR